MRSIRWLERILLGAVVAVGFGMTASTLGAQVSSRASTATGDLRLERLTSTVFGNTRTLRVLLPSGYGDRAHRNNRYPVLYLNDGQNVFDVATSIFNPMEWEADETATRLIEQGTIPPIIIVGIDCAGRHERFNEYFPYYDEYLRPPIPSPKGKLYPDFLVGEVMPFINARYRTKTGSANTGIGGSSAGGVAALQAAIARPEVFGYLLIESPSLYINDGQLIKDSANVKRWPERIYLGVGTNEGGRPNCKPGGPPPEVVTDVLRFKSVLEKSGLGRGRLSVLIEDCTRHDEAAWAKRLPFALKFLFGRPR